MKHIDYLKKIVGLFEFRVISDKRGNEFVLLADNMISNVDFVEDKTAFEASENHVHIINNIMNHLCFLIFRYFLYCIIISSHHYLKIIKFIKI